LKLRILTAFPQVGDKKGSVTLGAFGLYRGIGPGTDIHLFKVWRSIVVELWGREDADGRTVWMSGLIKVDEGKYTK